MPTQRFSIKAQDPTGRLGDLGELAPGTDVTVRLIARAQLEVRLRDDANRSPFKVVEVVDSDNVLASQPCFDTCTSVYFEGLLPGRRLVRLLHQASKVEAFVDLEPDKSAAVTLTVP